jgi:hypothetical protein
LKDLCKYVKVVCVSWLGGWCVGWGLRWEEGARWDRDEEREVVQGATHVGCRLGGGQGVAVGTEGENVIDTALVGDLPVFSTGKGVYSGVDRETKGGESVFIEEGSVMGVMRIKGARGAIGGIGDSVPVS